MGSRSHGLDDVNTLVLSPLEALFGYSKRFASIRHKLDREELADWFTPNASSSAATDGCYDTRVVSKIVYVQEVKELEFVKNFPARLDGSWP